jgi:hypothetical protein
MIMDLVEVVASEWSREFEAIRNILQTPEQPALQSWDGELDLSQAVASFEPNWRKLRDTVEFAEAAADKGDTSVATYFWLHRVETARLARRYMRSLGVDLTRRCWRKHRERVAPLDILAVFGFGFAAIRFMEASSHVQEMRKAQVDAERGGRDPSVATLRAMAQSLSLSPAQWARMMNNPSLEEGWQLASNIVLSAYLSTGLSVDKTRLRTALEDEGPTDNYGRRHRLRERLPASALLAASGLSFEEPSAAELSKLLSQTVSRIEEELPESWHQKQGVLNDRREMLKSINQMKEKGVISPDEAEQWVEQVEKQASDKIANINKGVDSVSTDSAAPAPLQEFMGREAVMELLTRARLSPREMEICSLCTEGYSTADIGQRLGITESTVRVHLHNASNKLRSACGAA